MMTSILVARVVHFSLLTLEEGDYDDPPNLGTSQVPEAGSDAAESSVGESMQCMEDPLSIPPFAA